jgi:hypothetical protein
LAAAVFCFGVFGFQQVEGAQGEGRAKPVLPELQDIETLSLDEALDEAMQRKEFAWRMPRDLVPVPEEDKNIFVRFADSMTAFVRKSIQDGMDWLEAFVKKMFTDQDSISGSGGNSFSTAAIVKGVSIIMLGIMGLLIAWTILRSRRQRKVAVEEIATAYAVPDLDDESVVASALPEEEWLGLARDLRAEGELRKAVRAYFLAGLASLGRVEVVRIARFKSNREYQRELQRRAYRCPGAAEPFSDSIRRFEQIWYGLYEVSDSELDEMADVVNQVRHRCVSPSGEDK